MNITNSNESYSILNNASSISFQNELKNKILLDKIISETELDMELLTIALVTAGILSILVFIISIINKNYSQVDRLWSILPVGYNLLFLFYPIFKYNEDFSIHQIIPTTIIVMWGIRLTYNYYRKGGYNYGSEDYRWEYVKNNMIQNKCLFELFNLTFISIYQNYLILFFALPGYIVYLNRNNSFNPLILIAYTLQVGFWIITCIADQQQWNFQCKKYELKEKNIDQSPYNKGFIQSGLFRFSRHPNFFGEIMFWWCFYLASCFSDSSVFNISFFGAFLLNLLFLGSTDLTEKLSSKKYPLYKEYQIKVNKLILWFPSNCNLTNIEDQNNLVNNESL